MQKGYSRLRPLVSVLIPAYNCEKWVGQAIQSATSQTWPHKEIIVVDDGSRDRTLEAARKFESKYVKVISQKNRGASAARNHALSHAQGDFIQWLDADDLLAADKIECQLRRGDFDSNTSFLFSSSFCRFYHRFDRARFLADPLWQDLPPLEYMLLKLRDNLWMSPAVWLVSRKLTEKAGLWDEELSLDDDGEYFCRVVLASEEILFVPEAKVFKRERNTGLSSRTSLKACQSLFSSHKACFRRILAVEDSPRARQICLQTLQRWLIYYYPEKSELIQKANELSRELGGRLVPPRFTWKYALIQRIFGWSAAKTAQFFVPKLKIFFMESLDRMLSCLPV